MNLAATARPSARPSPARLWRVERRPAEGGRWARVGAFGLRERADDEMRACAAGLALGDLVRLRDPRGRVRAFSVFAGDRGLLDAGEVPPAVGAFGPDWEAAWEGPFRAETDDVDPFLQLALGVDPRRLVLAAVACAEEALGRTRGGDARIAAALDDARGWAEGRVAPERAAAAAEAAFDCGAERDASPARIARDPSAFGGPRSASAAWAAADAALAASLADPQARLDQVVSAAGMAKGSFAAWAQWEAGPFVRRWVPLSVLLLGRAGVPTPPDLVL